MLRLLGVAFGVAVTVGGTVGTGILRTPGMVAGQLHYPWLIAAAWLLGGGYAVVGTLSIVELGTALPAAGGFYVYARRAFGDVVGFVVAWGDWLMQCASLAYIAVSVADFAVSLAPTIAPAAKLLALAPLALFGFIQWLGLRASSWTQQATSLVKGLALLAFVAVCFAHGPAGRSAAAAGVPASGLPLLTLVGVVIAMQSVIVTYDGWYMAIYFTEEDEDPARNLPRAALVGVLATVAIYVLVNLALLRVLSMPELAASSLPAADAAQAIFGGRGGPIVTGLGLLSLLGIVHAILMSGTRIAYAVARRLRLIGASEPLRDPGARAAVHHGREHAAGARLHLRADGGHLRGPGRVRLRLRLPRPLRAAPKRARPAPTVPGARIPLGAGRGPRRFARLSRRERSERPPRQRLDGRPSRPQLPGISAAGGSRPRGPQVARERARLMFWRPSASSWGAGQPNPILILRSSRSNQWPGPTKVRYSPLSAA